MVLVPSGGAMNQYLDLINVLNALWTSMVTIACKGTKYGRIICYVPCRMVANMQVDGQLTLGENIADNGGIHTAFQAYKDVMDQTGEDRQTKIGGHTLDQLFFVAFAQVTYHICVAIQSVYGARY